MVETANATTGKSRRNVLRGIVASTAGLGLASTTTTAQNGHAQVLLVKDCDPWSNTPNEDILTERGIAYVVIGSGDFDGHDLGGYCAIIIPSTQDQSYYDNLFAARAKLADFVSAGNVLVAHATDEGHPCTATWTDSFLPEGVGKENFHTDDLTIVDGGYPVVDGLTDSDISGWDSSTHGYLVDLPAGATIVAGVVGDPTGQPTYAQYAHGDGTGLATMMTLEWDGADRRMLEN